MTECDPKTCPLNQVSLDREEVKTVLRLIDGFTFGFNSDITKEKVTALWAKLCTSLYTAPRSLVERFKSES